MGRTILRLILAVLLLAGLPAAARADMKATYLQPRRFETVIVEVADNGDSRLQFSGQRVWLQVVGGQGYAVYTLLQGVRVVRLADLRQLFAERWPAVPDTSILAGLRLVQRGTASFAGHRGIAYFAQRPNDAEPVPIPMLVVSEDPALAPLGRPIAGQMDFAILSYRLAGATIPPIFVAVREALGSGTPLSFFGMELQYVDRSPIDPARFRLPAPPVTMEELRAGGVPRIG
ncbi:MAG: hypothetical protein QOD42_1278 [Sphingomonadales bacterium]|jgi:hypothetical protein|nr:hypothetical protein [Sphingomonadales bacterium]